MKNKNKLILLSALCAGIIGACGVIVTKKSEANGLQMAPISELDQKPEPTLIGGRAADPKDWPASVYASMNGAACTATVVGEKVLFIASHCVNNGGSASFKINGKQYTSKCEHSPDYRRDSTADWALCVVSEKVEGIQYEVVNQDEQLVKVGDEVLLTGFGCIRQGGGGGNDGTYRVGEAKVQRVTQGDNDIVTKGGAALCFGDSGGPAFKYLDEAKTKRVQISINSRGDIRTMSYLSAVHTAPAKKFLKDWSQKNGVKICGVHEDAVGCRNGVMPDPRSECKKTYDKLGACLFGMNRLMLTEEGKCKDIYAALSSCLEQAVWDGEL